MRNSMKERMEQGKDLLAALVANINVHDTMIKMRDGHEIMVRIFQPKEPKEGGSPLAVMYHGGGFILGDPAVETVNCALMCDKMGFVCVSVDYRLAPEHKFPVGINDSWDALQWVCVAPEQSFQFVLSNHRI
jgi:acetyl esterase/lipase